MSESRPPVQAVAVSLPGSAQELVRQRLPLVFRVQSVERYPLPRGGVRNVASLFNEAAAIQVDWLSPRAEGRRVSLRSSAPLFRDGSRGHPGRAPGPVAALAGRRP